MMSRSRRRRQGLSVSRSAPLVVGMARRRSGYWRRMRIGHRLIGGHGGDNDDPRRLLAIYLRDHRAGAAAGLRLVRRCRKAEDGGQLGARLAELEIEIDEDRRTLDSIMAGLGVRPSRVKSALAAIGTRVGRLKLNGQLWGRSPLSTVLELDTLAAGVFSKRNLWTALRAVADEVDELDPAALDRLIPRADAQLSTLGELHVATSRTAFGGAPL